MGGAGMIDRLVIFGASGDLTARYLLPALARLHAAGALPDGFEVAGAARNDLDDDGFRRSAAEALERFANDVPAASRDAVVNCLTYQRVDVADEASVARAVGGEARPVAVYLALPPGLFSTVVETLGRIGMAPGSRIVLEKPFGEDLESATRLNGLLGEVAGVPGEQAVFRVDHFLGMATVQNVLGLRLANRILEPLWNGEHIERVEIVWEETLALEGRAGYYDGVGQLKDMIQNHLLQVLCLVAMEPPGSLDGEELRDRKLEALRTVRPLAPEDVERRTRRARYTAGRIGDREVPAYVDEDGVDPGRRTETFAEVELHLDSPRWAGTPFVLRTGKGLGRQRMEVVLRFKPIAHLPFGDGAQEPRPNELRIGLDIEQPNDLLLSATGIFPGSGVVPLALSAELPMPELQEYGQVLLDVLRGDSMLSIRGDEAEEAWRIVTPVLDAWDGDRVPLEEYPAGSDGPPPR